MPQKMLIHPKKAEKLRVIIEVRAAIFTKNITEVIKNNPKNIGKNVIAN